MSGRLHKGLVVNNYKLHTKLGSGRFANVWSADKNGARYAVKIYKGSADSKYPENEMEILAKLKTGGDESNLLLHSDSFQHDGRQCIVYPLMGDHLGRLVDKYTKEKKRGVPIPMVKYIMREIFRGLDKMHSRGLIHADIKPENILLSVKAASVYRGASFGVYVGDLGSSTPSDDIFSYTVGTDEYIAPEIILGTKYTSAADIWAAFTVCYELVNGYTLFDVHDECDVDYGFECCDDSSESDSGDSESDSDDRGDSDSSESDSESDSDDDAEEINYRLLKLMWRVLGPAPRSITENGRLYYNSRGLLKQDSDLESITLTELMHLNYKCSDEECKEFSDFMLFGLRYDPGERPTARQVLEHPWLRGG